MTFEPNLDADALRAADFIPGPTVTLADGGPWTFPDPAAVAESEPALEAEIRAAEKAAYDAVFALAKIGANFDAVARKAERGEYGKIATAVETTFAVYRAIHRAGTAALKRNYALSDDDCRRLMPFDYDVSEILDPESRVHRAGPRENAMSQAVGVAVGFDFSRLGGRIGATN